MRGAGRLGVLAAVAAATLMAAAATLMAAPATLIAAPAAPAAPAAHVAAASTFQVESVRDSCTTTAGHHGYGRLIFQVRGIEIGETGTTYIRAIPTAQRWSGSRWIWIYELPFAQSLRFPNDGDTYSVDFDAVRWDIPRSERTYRHRLKFTVQFWASRRGPDKLLRTVTRYGKAC